MLIERIQTLTNVLLEEDQSSIKKALQRKAQESGLSYKELKRIFKKGEDAWEDDPSLKYNKYQLGYTFVDNYIKSRSKED